MENPTDNSAKTPVQPPTGRFMDLKGPENGEQTTPDANVSESEAQQVTVSTPDTTAQDMPQVTGPQVIHPEIPQDVTTEQSVTPEASAPDAAAEQAVPMSESAPESPAEDHPSTLSEDNSVADLHPEAPALLAATAAHKSSKAPIVAVIIAIIVTLSLTGLVVYTFLKSKDSSTSNTTSSTNSESPVAKPVASPQDVDQTASDVDASINSVDDATDLSSTDISDTTLGL